MNVIKNIIAHIKLKAHYRAIIRQNLPYYGMTKREWVRRNKAILPDNFWPKIPLKDRIRGFIHRYI